MSENMKSAIDRMRERAETAERERAYWQDRCREAIFRTDQAEDRAERAETAERELEIKKEELSTLTAIMKLTEPLAAVLEAQRSAAQWQEWCGRASVRAEHAEDRAERAEREIERWRIFCDRIAEGLHAANSGDSNWRAIVKSRWEYYLELTRPAYRSNDSIANRAAAAPADRPGGPPDTGGGPSD